MHISSESSDEDFEDIEVPAINNALTNPDCKKKMSSPLSYNSNAGTSTSHTECLSISKEVVREPLQSNGNHQFDKSCQKTDSDLCSYSLEDSSSTICPSPNDCVSNEGITNEQIFSFQTAEFMLSPLQGSKTSFSFENHSVEGDGNLTIILAPKSPGQQYRDLTSPLSSHKKNLTPLDFSSQKSPAMPSLNVEENSDSSSPISAVHQHQSLSGPLSSPVNNIAAFHSSAREAPATIIDENRNSISSSSSTNQLCQNLTNPFSNHVKSFALLHSSAMNLLVRQAPVMNDDGNPTIIAPPKSPVQLGQSLTSPVASPVRNFAQTDSSLSKSPLGLHANPATISPIKSHLEQCQSLTSPVASSSKNISLLDFSHISESSEKSSAFEQVIEKHSASVNNTVDFQFSCDKDNTSYSPDDAFSRKLCDSTPTDNETVKTDFLFNDSAANFKAMLNFL